MCRVCNNDQVEVNRQIEINLAALRLREAAVAQVKSTQPSSTEPSSEDAG